MEEDGARVEASLGTFIAEVARRRFGVRDWAAPLSLSLDFALDDAGEWSLVEGSLLEALESALAVAGALASPLKKARVFCHRCETAECPHSVPPVPTEVFAGYGQTGQAVWADLGQVLLEHRHPDIDRFYEMGPRLLAQVISGRDLKEVQLPAFGRRSKSYDILHQVVVGHYPLRAPGSAGRETEQRVALTAQAVEFMGVRGETRLELNVIGRTEGPEDALLLLIEAHGERIAGPLRKMREALRALEDRLKEPAIGRDRERRSEVLGKIPGLTRKLARDLTVDVRRKRGRTAHADERRRQSRPVPSAIRESMDCTLERTLVDEREDTFVVLGRRNRVHVFAFDGRLVTSLAMEAGAVDRRLRQKRWRQARPEEFSEFQAVMEAPRDR